MTTFYGDLETYSDVPIKDGVYRYAESAEILLFSYAIDDEPVSVVDFTTTPALGPLKNALESADEVIFHNSPFDRSVLRAQAPLLCPPLERWRDTRVQALAHSLPGALEKLCAILNVDLDKRKLEIGKQLVRLFCMPRPKNSKIRRATRATHPSEWKQFVDYAVHDVEAMRAIHKKLPTWNYSGAELALWHLDQRINDRGFAVDVALADAAIRTAEREKQRLAARSHLLTGGEVESATQRDKLLAYILAEHGVQLPDMTADTLERRVNDEDLPEPLRELLKVRLQASSASVAKYKAMMRSVCADGRIRGSLQFCGAMRTGRWSGRLVQPQNFMRTPKYLANDEVDVAAEAIALDGADLLYEKPMEVLSAGVPWTIVAPPGKKFVIADLSNIEGRVLAWLAGEDWKLEAYREQDADPENKTKDLYIIGYAKTFRESIAEVVADYEAGGKKRQFGKVQELFLGYQGLVGAYATGAETYRLDLTALVPALATMSKNFYDKAAIAWNAADANEGRVLLGEKSDGRMTYGLAREVYMVCHAFAHMWRAANPKTVQFWYQLEDAVRSAINSPENVFGVGPHLEISRLANWLRIKLPSGCFLCYPSPKVDIETGKISYMGVNQYTRRWQRILSYGGKFAENITQAIATGAFGLLGAALPRLEAAGYETVFHVHDEPVAEVPDTDDYSAKEMSAILATPPDWPGIEELPLSAGGYETHRYRKD